MTPQAKGVQIGGAIAVALCAGFLVRWWMAPAAPSWCLAADGSAWEAARDINGAALLPERKYRVSGTGAAPAEIGWTMQATDSDAPPRSGTSGKVDAGAWELTLRAGVDAPRRATVAVRVMPAGAVDAQTLRIELAR